MSMNRTIGAILAVGALCSSLLAEGSFESGTYPNHFEAIGKSDAEVTQKINDLWAIIFEGAGTSKEHIYRESGSDMAYMYNARINGTRSTMMGDGMMTAVQMDRQDVFDKLWNWVHTNMYQTSGEWQGYIAQNCTNDGQIPHDKKSPISNGSEKIVMSLWFAANRWGSDGTYNYEEEAETLLKHWVTDASNSGSLFHKNLKLALTNKRTGVFVKNAGVYPYYYELWSLWTKDEEVRAFFEEATTKSRQHLQDVTDPFTGLMPFLTKPDGSPGSGEHGWFHPEAHETVQNLSTDYAWFAADPWQLTWANTYTDWVKSVGIDNMVGKYTTSGVRKDPADWDWPTGIRGATASLYPMMDDKTFGEELLNDSWGLEMLQGKFDQVGRNSMYMHAMMLLGGKFKIYKDGDEVSVAFPGKTRNAGSQLNVLHSANVARFSVDGRKLSPVSGSATAPMVIRAADGPARMIQTLTNGAAR